MPQNFPGIPLFEKTFVCWRKLDEPSGHLNPNGVFVRVEMHALKLYHVINMFMAMPSCTPLGTSPTAFPMSPWATLARGQKT